MRGDQDRRGTIGSAASHIGDSDISLNRRFCQGKKRGTVFVARDRGHERAREPEKRRGRARGGEDVLVGRSKDVNVFVNRRKDVFVFVIGKLPCSFLPGELARFDNSQNVEMHSLAGSGQGLLILDDNFGIGIFFGNGKRLLLEQSDMFLHTPLGLIQAVFNGVTNARETL